MNSKYLSRKFIITALAILCGTIASLVDVMTTHLSLVLVAAIAAYNHYNVKEKQNGEA